MSAPSFFYLPLEFVLYFPNLDCETVSMVIEQFTHMSSTSPVQPSSSKLDKKKNTVYLYSAKHALKKPAT